jgi:hypothetical protein
MFFALRGMTSAPVASMTSGGFFWFSGGASQFLVLSKPSSFLYNPDLKKFFISLPVEVGKG